MSDQGALVALRDDGGLDLTSVDRSVAAVLLTLPTILDPSTDTAVRQRLFPDVSEDDERANQEWRALMHPELFHLLGSARDVISSDLHLLAMTSKAKNEGRLEIPGKHRDAWISGLQAARLTLGAKHGLDRYEHEIEPGTPAQERERIFAHATMELFGELLWRLVSGALDELPAEGRHPLPRGGAPADDLDCDLDCDLDDDADGVGT